MANSKMKLELLLKGIDQMSGVVKKQSPLLRRLDKDATKAYNSLKKLFSLSPKNNFNNLGKQSSAEFRKANSEVTKYKRTLESIGKIKMPKISAPFFDGSPKINPRQGQKELDKFYNSRRTPNRYVDRLAKLNDRVLEPTTQIKNVWREQYDSLKQYTDETSKLLRLQGRFKQMNLGEVENRKMFAAVEQNTKNVRGISLSDSMDIASNIFNALNSVDATIASLGTASKYQVAMKALYSDKFSPETINEQVLQGYKFVELTGKTKDQATMESRFNVLSKVVSSTGGEVTMAKFLALGKQASPIMQTVTDKGVMNTAAAIDTMGGERVGTALSALNRAWVGGIMPQHVAQRYADLGLIKEGGIEYGKGQKLKRIKPGANVLGDAFVKDPLEASKILADAIKKDAAKKGIDVSTPEGMNKQMRGLFGTETQYRLANEFINNLSQVEKESNRAEKSEGAIDTYARMAKDNDPLLKLKEYEAALQNFRTEAGKPLIEVGTKLTSVITPLLQLAAEHPTLTQFALATILISKGINGIGQTASILNSAGGGLASFFKKSQSSANAATQSIQNFSRESNGLQSRKIGIGLQIASVVGIDLLIRLIEWEIGKAMEAQSARNAAKDSIKTGDKTWDNYVADLAAQGRKPSKSEIDSQASVALMSAMNLGLKDTLPSLIDKKPVAPWKGNSVTALMAQETFLYPFAPKNEFRNGFFSQRGNKNELAEGFKKTAPTLKDPNIMATFLRLMETKIPNQKDQQAVKQGLETAFPESFAKAVQMNAESASQLSTQFMNLITPTGSVVEQFLNLQGKSGEAVTGVGNLANATNNAANRINSLEITPPTFGTINIPTQAPAAAQPFSLFGFPGRAKGGRVKRGMPYQVGEVGRELFLPDTNGSIIPNDALRRRGQGGPAVVHLSFNPTVNVNSDNPNANQIADTVNRELAKFRSELNELLNPDRLAQKVEWAAERDSERS